MIRLIKSAEPPALTAEHAARSGRYRLPEVKEALLLETSGKCAYCESRMRHVDYGDIEHIMPKRDDAERATSWNNLTLACGRCNTEKGVYESVACPLINPYIDHIDDHLEWIGPMLAPGSPDRGRMTISQLELNRMELLGQRTECLDRLHDILVRWASSEGAIREALSGEIARLTRADSEYAAACIALAADRGWTENDEDDAESIAS